MKESSFKRCKKLMIFFNILFLIAGLALLGLGIWVIVDFGSFSSTLGSSNVLFQPASYIAIAIGGLTVILSLCGCIGAWKESKCLLIIYSVLLIIFILIEIAVAVLAFAFTTHFDSIVSEAAVTSIKNEYGQSSAVGQSATEGWNFLQISFKCCGYNGGTDYTSSSYASTSTNSNPWPISCCAVNSAGNYIDSSTCLGSNNPSTQVYNSKGCSSEIRRLTNTYAMVVGGVAVGVVVIELLAVIFSCCVYSNIGNYYN